MAMAIVMAMVLVSCSSYRVYSVSSRPSQKVGGGMVYSLPYTLVRVAVTVEHTDLSTAPYAAYAEMVGLPAPDSLYHIASVEVGTTLVADPQRYYFVTPGRMPVCIDNRGLLRSVGETWNAEDVTFSEENIERRVESTEMPSGQAEYNLYDRADTFYLRTDNPGRPSLIASKKDVRSLRMQAEAAAERIREIQEKKQELLFGEYEGNYGGDAIRFIYNQLCEQERLLLAQFTGQRESHTEVYLLNPKDEKSLIDSQMFHLSHFMPDRGLCNGEGTLITCEVRCENSLRRASRFIKHRTKTVASDNWTNRRTFKYRIPETASVRVYIGEEDYVEKLVKISQFGTVANLPAGRCHARFDPHTGDLIFFRK